MLNLVHFFLERNFWGRRKITLFTERSIYFVFWKKSVEKTTSFAKKKKIINNYFLGSQKRFSASKIKFNKKYFTKYHMMVFFTVKTKTKTLMNFYVFIWFQIYEFTYFPLIPNVWVCILYFQLIPKLWIFIFPFNSKCMSLHIIFSFYSKLMNLHISLWYQIDEFAYRIFFWNQIYEFTYFPLISIVWVCIPFFHFIPNVHVLCSVQ